VARVGTRRVPGCNLPCMDRHAVGKRIGNWHVIKRRPNQTLLRPNSKIDMDKIPWTQYFNSYIHVSHRVYTYMHTYVSLVACKVAHPKSPFLFCLYFFFCFLLGAYFCICAVERNYQMLVLEESWICILAEGNWWVRERERDPSARKLFLKYIIRWSKVPLAFVKECMSLLLHFFFL
jgi:hypothetical protein